MTAAVAPAHAPSSSDAQAASPLVARAYFVLSIFIFRGVLDLCYLNYLSISFLDDPITPMPLNFNQWQWLASYLLVIPVAFIVPYDKRNLSGIFYLAALAFLYVPMTSMVGMNDEKSLSALLLVLFAILVSRALIAIPTLSVPMPSARQGFPAAIALSTTMVAVFVVWSIISGAASNWSLNLDDIYLYRKDLSTVLDPGLMAYINLWAQKVFNPFLIAIGLFYRKRFLVIACVLLQFYFFAVTQHRTHMFVPVLIFFVYLLYTRRIQISHIYNMFSMTLAFLLLYTMFVDLEQVLGIVVRRAFFVAASVTYDWIAYFNVNPHVYFADNLLKNYVINSYTGQNLPTLMSYLVFSGPEFGFNVGLVGTGYAHLGLFGVFLYACLIGAIVWFANGLVARGLPPFIAAAMLIEPMRTVWADSDLFTAILSHGILIGLLLMWIHGAQHRPTPVPGHNSTS